MEQDGRVCVNVRFKKETEITVYPSTSPGNTEKTHLKNIVFKYAGHIPTGSSIIRVGGISRTRVNL